MLSYTSYRSRGHSLKLEFKSRRVRFKSRRFRGKLCLLFSLMACEPPKILVLGHSFVRRLREDLEVAFDERASRDFHLQGTARVRLYGVGGRTVSKLRQHDLSVVSSFAPDIVILEIGTNDLAVDRPEVVGSEIEELVRFLREDMSIRVVGVCEVIPRGVCSPRAENFNESVSVLNQYLRVVLPTLSNVFCWRHIGFHCPSLSPYLADGVHVNSFGQYQLYRSYRGAMLKALGML